MKDRPLIRSPPRRIGCDEQPIGSRKRGVFRFVNGIVCYKSNIEVLVFCKGRKRRSKVHESIRNVKGEYASRRKMAAIDSDSLAGQEVHRNRIARECVDRKNIEVLWRFVFESQSSVAQCDAGLRGTVGEVGELPLRDVNNLGVYFVITHLSSGFAIGGNNTGAEPDDTDGKRFLKALALPRNRKADP